MIITIIVFIFWQPRRSEIGLLTEEPGFDSRFSQKTFRVHVMYLLVKSMVLKIPWSVFSSLPCMLSREYSPPLQRNQNCGDGDGWCCRLLSKAAVGTLPLYMDLASQETFPFALHSIEIRYGAWAPKFHKTTTKTTYSYFSTFTTACFRFHNKTLSHKRYSWILFIQ